MKRRPGTKEEKNGVNQVLLFVNIYRLKGTIKGVFETWQGIENEILKGKNVVHCVALVLFFWVGGR